ncbi:MAG: hypothetical protein ACR2NP_18830 [Pirellulaceae bacterium]
MIYDSGQHPMDALENLQEHLQVTELPRERSERMFEFGEGEAFVVKPRERER